MKKVDTRGQLCPKPIIMAKALFNELDLGEQMEVLTDNETSLNNLIGFFTALNAMPVSEKQSEGWSVFVSKPLKPIHADINPEDYCETPLRKGFGKYVIAIKSDRMGDGDDDLGKILIRGFVNALSEQEVLPTHIIFYNSGVKLAIKGSDTAESLLKLENIGVTIVLCGTCVDFYALKEQVAVGMISNMYHITNLLREADKVLVP